MAIQFPSSRKEVEDRIKTDVQNELPESNPFLRNSFLGSLITGFAGRIYDFYLQLKNLLIELFPDTATGSYLDRRGSDVGIVRESATQARGFCTVNGTPAISIPISTELQSLDGQMYRTLATTTINTQVLNIVSLTRSGQTATATFPSDHLLASSITVTISGANETEYNITTEITVISATKFQYEVQGAPATPATGTIISTSDNVSIEVNSDEYGEIQNQGNGAALAFTTSIAGVSTSSYVQYSEIGGGADTESDSEYRTRVVDRYKNPVAHFNVAEIVNISKQVAGVTRVWVDEITPEPGDTTIHFTRDNDDTIIPSPSEVAKVKNKILTIKPANTPDSSVIVNAPNPVSVDFIFFSLSPNTETMRVSITNSLKEFFSENTDVGTDITKYAYESAIWNTVDEETGARINAFVLTTPVADIAIAAGELGVLGNITFP
jgi:uncharacterized phage protein gp47/JayE